MKYRSNFLTAKDVADWLDVSESAIYKWVNEGNFPKPYKFGNGDARRSASRWSKQDIDDWLEARRTDD